MPTDEEILKELKKISKIIILSNGSILEKELSKYATTDERKKIWTLIDDKKDSEQIANEIKITKRSVDRVLQQFELGGLIEERKYGIPPKRIVDYVPPSWLELLQNSSKSVEESQTQITQPANQSSQESVPNV